MHKDVDLRPLGISLKTANRNDRTWLRGWGRVAGRRACSEPGREGGRGSLSVRRSRGVRGTQTDPGGSRGLGGR